jgi:hypothetical protein
VRFEILRESETSMKFRGGTASDPMDRAVHRVRARGGQPHLLTGRLASHESPQPSSRFGCQPFSESQFRTITTGGTERFGCIQDIRSFCQGFFRSVQRRAPFLRPGVARVGHGSLGTECASPRTFRLHPSVYDHLRCLRKKEYCRLWASSAKNVRQGFLGWFPLGR